ncbi:MAG: HNH endonuclease [Allosphingosinicella sp.]|uniref:HNH endonuclease n=1 Tax=Allosphingosinicella sp. TaxID=2823234 RepID=UPI00395626BD
MTSSHNPSPDDRLRSLGFAKESEIQEAAFNHGYQRFSGLADGWYWFRSDTAPGEIALAASKDHWFLAVQHGGVAAELKGLQAEPVPPSATAAFSFPDRDTLRASLSRAYHLARSLPTAPLQLFQKQISALGQTEVERLARQRVGQDIFRRALLDYWGEQCPLTGITDPALLRASHIVPWSECGSDADRLDVHNGLLLSSLWDSAFDTGLVSFNEDGLPLLSPFLGQAALYHLHIADVAPLALTTAHHERLAWHRAHVFRAS